MDANMRVEMPDGSKWDVPVSIIAKNRAEFYKDEFDGDIEKSLTKDTIPLFENVEYEIEDWAQNNMYWSEVEPHATKVEDENPDYEDGWCNGDKEIIKD